MDSEILVKIIRAITGFLDRGDNAGAERYARDALAENPPHVEIWRLLAIAQLRNGDRPAARRSLEQARHLDPSAVDALITLAALETLEGRADDAQRAFEEAIRIAPDHPIALSSLGRLRHRRGDYDGAADCFERAVIARPDAAEPLMELANARVAQQRWSDAETALQKALQLRPDSSDAWYVLGYLFERQGRLRDAAMPYERSLALQPRAQAAHNLGLVYDRLGEKTAAVRAMQRALDLDPTLLEMASHLAFAKRQICDWSGIDALGARLRQAVDADVDGIGPFAFLAEDSTPAQQLRCARTFARRFSPTPQSLPMRTGTSLRVGFVSSGFNQHATGLLIVELIERLREFPLQTIAFATTAGDGTMLRDRLEAAFQEFHDVADRSSEEIAERIRVARIDILIDVDGYCMGSQPALFAQRPAPVQINWLAYPGTLGASWYDYLIADHFVIPETQRAHYDENMAYLPRCYQPTDTTRAIPEAMSRERCGLPPHGFVFCCFNNGWKIAPRRFALWMRLLAEIPDSVLWLLESTGDPVAARLRDAARLAGIDPRRLVFAAKAPHEVHLSRLRSADVFLDTSPYGAHTTASDAIYAGCPVLTLPGDTFASRVAGSLNVQLGLEELIARDEEDYLRIAKDLARAPQRLAALRAQLTEPATRAKLFDIAAYAHDFAALLTRIADRSRRGEPPTDISM
jgi:predicted O-linked N-acetylglucosamine transferase (SPINDLY family)